MRYIILISLLLLGCTINKPKNDMVCTMTWIDGQDTTFSCTGSDVTKALSERTYQEYLEYLEEQREIEKKKQEQENKRKQRKNRSTI